MKDLEERLNAYLDGELDLPSRLEIETLLGDSPQARQLFEDLQAEHRELVQVIGRSRSSRDVLHMAPFAKSRSILFPFSSWILLSAAAGFVLGVLVPRSEPNREPDTAPHASHKTLAQLRTSSGPLEIRLDKEADFHPLETGASIPVGAEIRTSPSSKASFALSDGSSLRLDRSTHVRFFDQRSMALEEGRLLASVVSHPERFVVKAGLVPIEGLEAIFELTRSLREEAPPVTRLVVLEGTARFGDREILSDHECSAIGADVPEPSPLNDVLLVTTWVNELMALEGENHTELTKRIDAILAMLGRTKMEMLYEWEIRSLGDHAFLPLLRFLQNSEDSSPSMKHHAAEILADIATPDRMKELAALLSHDDRHVRTQAARALARLAGTNHGYDEVYWNGDDVENGIAAWKTWVQARDARR